MGKKKNLRNQTETEPKNRLIESIGLVLVLFYTILGFSLRLGLGLQNTKTMVSVNQPKNKKRYKYYTKIIKYNVYNIYYENKFIYRSTLSYNLNSLYIYKHSLVSIND